MNEFDLGPGIEGRSDDLAQCALRLFSSHDGQRLLDHLERSFLLRRVPPQTSDQELRHVEGQRSLVAYLQSLVARGKRR